MKTWTPIRLEATRPSALPFAWQPSFTQSSGGLKIKINPGTFNGFMPSNWKAEFTAPTGEVSFVRLKVESSAQKVTTVQVELVEEAQQSSFKQEPTLNFAPSPLYVLLGTIYNGQYYMNYNQALTGYPILWSTQEKKNYDFGTEPYKKYYIWKVV